MKVSGDPHRLDHVHCLPCSVDRDKDTAPASASAYFRPLIKESHQGNSTEYVWTDLHSMGYC